MSDRLSKRLAILEARSAAPSGSPEPSSPDFLNMSAILDEIAHLRSSRAYGLRGGVPIVPEDIPGKILGPSYTQRQLYELAVRRALEKRGVPKEEEARYVEALEVMGGGGIPIG